MIFADRTDDIYAVIDGIISTSNSVSDLVAFFLVTDGLGAFHQFVVGPFVLVHPSEQHVQQLYQQLLLQGELFLVFF